ncbi:acetolactate synthase large subunit [Deltaproteobacteria bacterium]|nr:acetolactate synthase large subunit [Deltaproteobacteria bacterium]
MSHHPALDESGMKMHNTAGHALARGLKRHGVTHVFGQSLPSLLFLAGKELGITQVAYRQENAGGYMADAYARLSGKPGIVTAQNGPGATLLVPPLAECMKASIPVIALVQEVNRAQIDKNAFQEFDHEAMFAPCAKYVRRVNEASRLLDYLDQAFTAACSGRPGPAVLLLPFDLLLGNELPLEKKTTNLGFFPLDRVTAASDRIDAAASVLAKAKKPIIIVGGGIHSSQAWDELAAIQEECSLPVATTVMGKGAVDERHPLSLGVMAYFLGPNGSGRYLRPLLNDADCIFLIGTRTNQNGTDSWSLYPDNATYIHLDVDSMEVGRNYEALRLVGDAKLTLAALRTALAKQDMSARKQMRSAVEKQIAEGKAAHLKESAPVRMSPESPIRPERIMEELNKRLTPDSIIVSDASYSSIWISNYLTSLKPGMRFITPRGLAGLGWGFPYALGSRVANPTAPIYCLVGDGGFGHVWSELETAVRMKLKVTLIVLNNGILGYQKHAENARYGTHTTAVDFSPVDHTMIAKACGANAVRVTDPDKLEEAFALADKAETVTLIEVMCDAKAHPPVPVFKKD